MHVQERIDEEAAIEICRVRADLAAGEVEAAGNGVVIETAIDKAAEHAEDERVALGPHIALAEIEAHLEVERRQLAVQIETVVAAIGARLGAVVPVEPAAGAPRPHCRRQRIRSRRFKCLAARIIRRGRRTAREQHAQIRGAVEPSVRALMPDVLGGGHQLRQQERARAGEASQLPEATIGRNEEQIIVEEAGVDGLRQLEVRLARRRTVHEDDRDAGGIEGARPEIGVVDGDSRGAGHIALDGESVGG